MVDLFENEEWRDVQGYVGLYQISSFGRVKSLARKIDHGQYIEDRGDVIMTPFLNKNGYFTVMLHKNRKKKQHRIHQMVARAFIPNPLGKEMINHIDCNTLNNRVDNLEWCTNSENQIHAMKNGLKVDFGANHPNSKLTEDDIRFIRSHYKFRDTVYNTRSLAEMFGVSHGIISRVISGKSYKNVV